MCDFSTSIKQVRLKQNTASGNFAFKPAPRTVVRNGRMCESRASSVTVVSTYSVTSFASSRASRTVNAVGSTNHLIAGSHIAPWLVLLLFFVIILAILHQTNSICLVTNLESFYNGSLCWILLHQTNCRWYSLPVGWACSDLVTDVTVFDTSDASILHILHHFINGVNVKLLRHYTISLDGVLSHWAYFTVHRFICVYLCVFCVFLFHTA